jgi:hypothetical protein
MMLVQVDRAWGSQVGLPQVVGKNMEVAERLLQSFDKFRESPNWRERLCDSWVPKEVMECPQGEVWWELGVL